MSTMTPVSVLLPVFNGMPWVGGALNSILEQSFQDLEVVVVDDGSTDRTASVLAGCSDERVRVLRHERNRGLVAALNTGLAACRGEWIARMDADDISHRDRLSKQMRFLQSHPDIGVLGTWWKLTDVSGNSWVHELPEEHEAIEWQLLFAYSMAHPTTITRKTFLMEAGGYDSEFSHVEDIDLWTRMLKRGVKCANLPEVLYERRLHGASVCALHSDIQFERYRLLRERMLRDWFPDPLRDPDFCLLAKVLSGTEALPGPEILLSVHLLVELYEQFAVARPVSLRSRLYMRKQLAAQLIDISQRTGYIHPKIARQWWRWIIPESVKRVLRRLQGAERTASSI